MDYSKLFVVIETVDNLDGHAVVYGTNTTTPVSLSDFGFSKTYWADKPTLTVTQIGHETIQLALSKSRAERYAYTVTDLDNHTQTGYIGADGKVSLVLANTMDINSTLYVKVVPVIESTDEDTPDVNDCVVSGSIVLGSDWNSVKNVSLADADSKKGSNVKITYSYNAPADGVYVQLYSTTGEAVFDTPVQISCEDAEMTVNPAKKTATVTLERSLNGKYYAEVTPYLMSVDEESTVENPIYNTVTVGDSAISSIKGTKLVSP